MAFLVVLGKYGLFRKINLKKGEKKIQRIVRF